MITQKPLAAYFLVALAAPANAEPAAMRAKGLHAKHSSPPVSSPTRPHRSGLASLKLSNQALQ